MKEKIRPVFSVLLPVYNREKLIARAIDSILAQTLSDFQLIIIDDGSTDCTRKIIQGYEDDRIEYYYKENGGQNSALNLGLKKAQGEYIAFCDSDDKWLPDKLEKCFCLYQTDEEIAVVYHWTGVEDSKGNIRLARKDTVEGWCQKQVLEQGYLTSPTFLTCKSACFRKIGEFDTKIVNCQDDDLCFNLVKYYKVGLVKKILGVYYFDADNRKGNNIRTGADSYLALWKKHAAEALEVCGSMLLAEKYYIAAEKYAGIKDYSAMKKTLKKSAELSRCSLIKRIKLYMLYIKAVFSQYKGKGRLKSERGKS